MPRQLSNVPALQRVDLHTDSNRTSSTTTSLLPSLILTIPNASELLDASSELEVPRETAIASDPPQRELTVVSPPSTQFEHHHQQQLPESSSQSYPNSPVPELIDDVHRPESPIFDRPPMADTLPMDEEYVCHPEQEITREAVIDLMMEKLHKSREEVLQLIANWTKKDFTIYLQIEHYIDQQVLSMKTSTRGIFSAIAEFIRSLDDVDNFLGFQMNPASKTFLRDIARYGDNKYCRRLSIIRVHGMNEGELINLENTPVSLYNQLTAIGIQLGLDCTSQIIRKVSKFIQRKVTPTVKRLKK